MGMDNESELIESQSKESLPVDNNGNLLFNEISELIERSRRILYAQMSSTTVSLFWDIGKRINGDILENKRADYGKKIVSQLATQLTEKYGRSYEVRNLRRMMQFAEQFSDFEITDALTATLRVSTASAS